MPINFGKKNIDYSTKSYKSVSEQPAQDILNDELLQVSSVPVADGSHVYRGMVSGLAFITNKGYRGQKLDSLWSKFIYDSFAHDDEELVELALRSCLADLNAVVSGGECGAPFYIGNVSFYCNLQFETQAVVLKEIERVNINPTLYLTPGEWEEIDEKLNDIAHYGDGKVHHTVRGDTFLALAIRKSSYMVAILLLRKGIDPLIENEESEDSIHLMKKQATKLVYELRECEAKREKASKEILLPSLMKIVLEKNKEVVGKISSLAELMTATRPILQVTIEEIDRIKRMKRIAELRREKLSEANQQLLSKEAKILEHIKLLDELKPYLERKLERHHEKVPRYIDFASRVRKMSQISATDYRSLRQSIRSTTSDPAYMKDQFLALTPLFDEIDKTRHDNNDTSSTISSVPSRSFPSQQMITAKDHVELKQLHDIMNIDVRRKSIAYEHDLDFHISQDPRLLRNSSSDSSEQQIASHRSSTELLIQDGGRPPSRLTKNALRLLQSRGDENWMNGMNDDEMNESKDDDNDSFSEARSELSRSQVSKSQVSTSQVTSTSMKLFQIPKTSTINNRKNNKYSAPIGILKQTEDTIVMYR